MNHGSLFTGEGGFDLAAEWMEWDNIFHCELNDNLRWFLNNRWPNAKSYADIKSTDFTVWRGKLDILSGGFPCQPYSQSGKRLGKEDDRHLWPEMLRAIREAQPTWVVGENVRGLINWNGGLVFDEVQTDLETEGYEVQPFLLPAAGVNAPHERYRIWFVAYSASNRWNRSRKKPEIKNWKKRSRKNRKLERGFEGLCISRNVANSNQINGNPAGFCTSKISQFEKAGIFQNNASNSSFQRLQRSQRSGEYEEKAERGKACTNGSTTKFCSGSFWKNFPTQSPVCTGDDGFSSGSLRQFIRENTHGLLTEKEIDKIIQEANGRFRKEVLMAGGNAVVPQIPRQIFKAIEEYNNITPR
ncbi:DNA cytosine methyltransferase [uncultured Christiangramia sp.]|uniref:DNA cytosine methyltransferase n=1 Tax=uncultured Christiangramia sp. TaxID=503836 RepID=UPI00262946AC|nr:DNA (cytosine-5-)-methyltransferase [uncultured Christiangramia sp.]